MGRRHATAQLVLPSLRGALAARAPRFRQLGRGGRLPEETALFAVVSSGAVAIEIGQRYPLREAARAHRDLEERRTTGCTVLVP